MAEYYDKQRKALEDDLRMFQEAERDNTDVEGSSEELPVIRSRAYKPESYGKYWDRENATLAYPEDERDMAKARWDAEHWDEEHGEPELISAGAARLREKPLGGSPMEYMDNAIVFSAPKYEKAFMRKMYKDLVDGKNDMRIAEHMNLTPKARDEITTAMYRFDENGGKYKMVTGDDVAHVQDPVVFSNELDANGNIIGRIGEHKMPKEVALDRDPFTADHENYHLYDRLAAIQEKTTSGKFDRGLLYPYTYNNTYVSSNNPAIRKKFDDAEVFGGTGRAMKDKSPAEQKNDFKRELVDRFMKLNGGKDMAKENVEKFYEVVGSTADGLAMAERYNMLTPAGWSRTSAFYKHPRNYRKEQWEKGGEMAEDFETAANTNALFGDPETGRFMRQVYGNENFLYPVHLKSDDIDVPALEKRLEAEGFVDAADDIPVKTDWSYKFRGPKYYKLLEEERKAVKPAGRLHTDKFNEAKKNGIGDRYGKAKDTDIEKDYNEI